MKFLVDAQLPYRLAEILRAAGHEAVHTLDLSMGNRTPDSAINSLSITEKFIVVTKDADFVLSFRLNREPYKLLLVSTGNISNAELEALVARNLRNITDALKQHRFVELDRGNLIVHE